MIPRIMPIRAPLLRTAAEDGLGVRVEVGVVVV